ncbi:Isoleucine--tRNA ligase, cytoplasmic [Oopsacas minuta]|uniref:Isoleucine--tRNA ligase, cytoplasmic n=1 Tax=Oopsacas minuta TaxID=111878 RepID=A0AAV7JYW3_9METZ|nr:Isoleucine--tRNA ligase, cytoplasmic [Oopsacas minuta]
MSQTFLKSVNSNINFPTEEESILKFWREINVFEQQLALSKDRPRYTFYDGPPFATGMPHYGHILAGTIKDVVTRYATANGFYVERRFGWDCHGLPVEYEIDKTNNILGPADVEKMGIDVYNAKCRSIVMRYASEWEKIVERMGRWIDFKNDYKTMYPWFMESIWWVFKQIYEKGMVYRGFKVMPFSSACHTPLSNFEAGQNYKEVVDPAIIVTFPLETDPDISLIAWTTTPWTLPSNLAVCVHPDFCYVKVRDIKRGKTYIMMEDRLCILFKKEEDYEIIEKFQGQKLFGLRYIPLFKYFEKLRSDNPNKGAFRVLTDTYVTSSEGTGVVHQAPGFGEDDYRICLANQVFLKDEGVVCPVDESGLFTLEITEYAGVYVKDADKKIIKQLNTEGRLIQNSSVKHNYPFCWRSETPLLYKAVPSWFIRVQDIIPKLLENNRNSYWVPEFVQERRFHNWLESSRDWAISRNRYWGTPMPIWTNADFSEVVCVGSIQELEELSGAKVTDLHRENIDHIEIPSKRGGPNLKRISEVLDCWFESGSMPYAQAHYPFDKRKQFDTIFPADFIAEGIDQTRGWFYTLLVISTILFGKAPFKNLVVNGIVRASNGQKMSKKLKNYPDPMLIVDKFGSDALRLYLVTSPCVRGEDMKFREEGVRDIIKDVFLPWFNAYRFLVQTLLWRDEVCLFVCWCAYLFVF